MSEKFFAILRLGLGQTSAPLPAVSADEWPELYRLATQHAVLGVALDGAKRLPADNYPPRPLLMQWIATTEQIRRRNKQLDHQCSRLTEMLSGVGIDSCVIKGQGVARMYPQPDLRSPGDIDLWVKLGCNPSQTGHDAAASASIDGSIREIVSRIASIGKGRLGKAVYHHVEWSMPGTLVEVHYRPQYFNRPIVNRRFQRWCNAQWSNRVGTCGYSVPSAGFNAVYMLAHLYHHLIFEGMIMKQVCDYCVLLSNCRDEIAAHRPSVTHTIRRLGMARFAAGIMWLLHRELHLPEDCLLFAPDEREGRFILGELMQTKQLPDYSHESTVARFVRLTRYRTRFLRHYPGEVLCDIPFRLYNWWWRIGRNGKKNRESLPVQ